MSCSLANEPSVSAFEACGAPAQGLYGYPGIAIPDDSQYTLSATRSKPAGATSGYTGLAEACLRARGLIYFKQNPGDCGSPLQPPGGLSIPQMVGLSGSAASGVIGGIGAAGVLSGAATLGIGTAVSLAVAGIEDIFAHHAQAVANEQQTICSVANYLNPLIRQIDAAVASGAITPAQGIAYLYQVCNQAQAGLDSISKPCNAGCVYSAICGAFMDFSNYFYKAIAPASIGAGAPGAAPAAMGTPPGGVKISSFSTTPPPAPVRSGYANTFTPAVPGSAPLIAPPPSIAMLYNQPSSQAAQATDIPPSHGLPSWLFPAAVIVIVILFVRAN